MLRRAYIVVALQLFAAMLVAEQAQARVVRRQPEPEDRGVASPSDIVPVRPLQKHVQSPAQAPLMAYKQAPVQGPIQKGEGCAPACVKYFHHGRHRCGCCETYETVLSYCDPCSGCVVNVPVCVPACLQGTPTICDRVGILGRSVVVFQWCGGYKVKVITDRCGDLAVHTYSR